MIRPARECFSSCSRVICQLVQSTAQHEVQGSAACVHLSESLSTNILHSQIRKLLIEISRGDLGFDCQHAHSRSVVSSESVPIKSFTMLPSVTTTSVGSLVPNLPLSHTRLRILSQSYVGGRVVRAAGKRSGAGISAEAAAVHDSTPPPFHLAFPVHDLALAREFYGGKLGLQEGRSSRTWVRMPATES